MGCPLENKNCKTITKGFSNILTKSKRKSNKIESDRGAKLYNSIYQNFFKSKNNHHYSEFKDKGPSMADRVIRAIRIFLKKSSVRKRKR